MPIHQKSPAQHRHQMGNSPLPGWFFICAGEGGCPYQKNETLPTTKILTHDTLSPSAPALNFAPHFMKNQPKFGVLFFECEDGLLAIALGYFYSDTILI